MRLPPRRCAERVRTLPAVPGPAVRRRLPGRHQYPRLHPEDQREGFPRRLRRPHRHQSAAGDLRPGVPAGKPVRRRVHRGRLAGTGRHRTARALGRRHRDRGGLGQHPLHRTQRLQDRHRRLRARRHGLRGRHGQGRVRRHGVRSLPPAGRRAALRHPRFPPAQRGDRRRDRQPAQARRQVRMQHAGRTPVHHRADDRRDGLSTRCSSASAPAIRRCSAFRAIR